MVNFHGVEFVGNGFGGERNDGCNFTYLQAFNQYWDQETLHTTDMEGNGNQFV